MNEIPKKTLDLGFPPSQQEQIPDPQGPEASGVELRNADPLLWGHGSDMPKNTRCPSSASYYRFKADVSTELNSFNKHKNGHKSLI